MYTIKRAAELTGISVATLRAWERRYGVVSPRRFDGGYRLYGPEDVRALAIMNSLVNEGWSAREAAAETTRRLSSRDPAGRGTPFGRVTAGAGPGPVSTLRPPNGSIQSEDAEALIRAAERLDSASATAVLDARFALGTFEHVVDDWLMPTLQLVGEEWAHGRLTVAGEHLVSYAVQRRLAAAYEAASGRVDGPTLSSACRPAPATSSACSPSPWPPGGSASRRSTSAPTCRPRTGRPRSRPATPSASSSLCPAPRTSPRRRRSSTPCGRARPELVIGLGGSQQDAVQGRHSPRPLHHRRRRRDGATPPRPA